MQPYDLASHHRLHTAGRVAAFTPRHLAGSGSVPIVHGGKDHLCSEGPDEDGAKDPTQPPDKPPAFALHSIATSITRGCKWKKLKRFPKENGWCVFQGILLHIPWDYFCMDDRPEYASIQAVA